MLKRELEIDLEIPNTSVYSLIPKATSQVLPDKGSERMTTAEVAYRASTHGIDERNELVMRELPQVYYVAARIRERLPKHVDMEDLVQAGVVGLLEACRNYDSSKDARFSTFAKFRIRGAILDSLRKLDWGSRTLRRRGRA